MFPMTKQVESEKSPSENSSPITLNMGKRISLRLYEDTRPRCLEIAPLQKGLVLLLDNRELIEEGAGFGLPVVKYEDKTYFSSTAKIFFNSQSNPPTLVKVFCLDTVSRKRLGKGFVNDGFYGFIHGFFEKAYLAQKELAPAFNFIMELRKTLKVETDFVSMPSRGNVKVAYAFFPDIVEVHVDFSQVQKDNCEEILVLNEQGSTFFTRYSDTDGVHLADVRIGAWENVKAGGASLSDEKGTLAFSLQNVDSARLFRGWERTRGRFSWAGLGYLLPKTVSKFNYDIQLKNHHGNNLPCQIPIIQRANKHIQNQ